MKNILCLLQCDDMDAESVYFAEKRRYVAE